MKKILFFVSSLNSSGGTERVMTVIADELVKCNYDIQFLSLYEGDNPFFSFDKSIKYDSLFENKISFKSHYLNAVKNLRKYINVNDIDIIINVESILAIFSIPACFGMNIRNICWEHFNFNVDLGVRIRKVSRQMAALFCDDIITLTEVDKRFWQQGSLLRANIVAIQNPSPFPVKEPRISVCSKVVLSAGRLTDQKGFDLLLNAWALVVKERIDWKLRIVGSGEDKERLKQQADDLNLKNSVEWILHSKNMSKEYEYSDIYVMSSRYEGLPMVLLEAQAFGLPIVSFDCNTGPREIINHSCGWLCENGNIEKLSISLLDAFQLFDKNDKYAECSKAAIDNSVSKFSRDLVVKKWIDLLNDE